MESMMRELSVTEEEAASYQQSVQQEAIDVALATLKIALGSAMDDLKTLQMQMWSLMESSQSLSPLAAEAAAKLGRKVYFDVVEQIWNELPFDVAELVANADSLQRLENQEFSVDYVRSFIEAAKPCKS
jgi:hypothetical protein